MIGNRNTANYNDGGYPRQYGNVGTLGVENGGMQAPRKIAKSTYVNPTDGTPLQPQKRVLGQQDQNRLYGTPIKSRPMKTTDQPGSFLRPQVRPNAGQYLAPNTNYGANNLTPKALMDSTPTTYPTYESGRTWRTNSPKIKTPTPAYTQPLAQPSITPRTVQPSIAHRAIQPARVNAPLSSRPVSTMRDTIITNHSVRTVAPAVVQNTAPVVERKLIYVDPETGMRMMKVCTPNGTIKRVECLDNIPELPINNQLDMEVEEMVRDAKEEFMDPKVEDFDVDGYPVKVEASKDGRFVFYGAEDFGTLERRGGWLTNEGIVHYDRNLSTIKALPNGDTVVNDFNEGWDLVLMDPNFMEKERLEGLGDAPPGYSRMIKTRVGDDDNYMIWMRGKHEISIVNTYDFSARHINNFWNYRGREVNAVAAAIDPEASRLVGIGFLPGAGEVQTIHVYDGGDGVSIFEGYDIIPEVGAWLCCEVSVQGDVFFLGGAEERRFEYGDAFLVAMSFDDEAELINFARYGDDTDFHCINSLKRHPDGNILFAGCKGYVATILWAGDQFHLISSVPSASSSPVTDMAFSKNALYSVNDSDRGTALYFDGRFNDRDPRGPEPPHGQYRDLPKTSNRMTLADQYRARPRIPAKYAGSFRDYDIQQIGLPGVENMRIQVTPDEKLLYVGRNELKVLERDGGQYRLLDNATHIKPFIDLKLMRDTGEVITFDENTSDLIKYDPSLTEMNRLDGAKKIDLEGNEIVTTLYQGDDFVYIWMLGNGSIGLCNPSNMTYELISNFFGNPEENVTPFTAIASTKVRKVMGLYIKDALIYFVFLRGDDAMIRKLQSDCLGDRGTVLCMETSSDDNIFFCGGSSQFELTNGVAKIFAMTFDEDIEFICDIVLPNNIINTMGVSDIKRMRNYGGASDYDGGYERDVLLAGTNAAIFVVEWTGSHFVILSQVEEIHSWLLNNIDYAGNTAYTVSHKDEHINRISFRQ